MIYIHCINNTIIIICIVFIVREWFDGQKRNRRKSTPVDLDRRILIVAPATCNNYLIIIMNTSVEFVRNSKMFLNIRVFCYRLSDLAAICSSKVVILYYYDNSFANHRYFISITIINFKLYYFNFDSKCGLYKSKTYNLLKSINIICIFNTYS